MGDYLEKKKSLKKDLEQVFCSCAALCGMCKALEKKQIKQMSVQHVSVYILISEVLFFHFERGFLLLLRSVGERKKTYFFHSAFSATF